MPSFELNNQTYETDEESYLMAMIVVSAMKSFCVPAHEGNPNCALGFPTTPVVSTFRRQSPHLCAG